MQRRAHTTMIQNSVHALCALIVIANGFNLSPKYAQFFQYPRIITNTSYFGYTVALQGVNSVTDEFRLVVGAPRSNSTWSGQASVMEPGLVFQCPVTSPGGTCTPIVLDKTGNIKERGSSHRYWHKKDNAWIGGSIDVGGDDGGLVVCGPRWSNQMQEGHYLMNGICYWKDDTYTLKKNASKTLLPLTSLDSQGRKNEHKKDIFYYALGAAGISVHLTKDTQELIIGAPGVFDWTGTVIRYNKQKGQIPLVPNPHLNRRLETYGYFGYSLDSGHFLKSTPNKTYYVSGAPRGAQLKGLVLVFDFPASNEEKLLILIELEGSQLGEYFGAAVCVVDLNGDGLDDLVVGAPLHSVVNSPGSREHSGDEGRAYVFINEDNKVMKEIGTTKKITGSTSYGSRFGSAIAKLGDINMDGYNDIAIGAPYEEGGKGAIYIYHGHQSGIQPKYSQRIAASDFPHAVSGFGISISRGLDIDGNHYNDLAVGAYTSGHAIIIRSRPVISLQPRLVSDKDHIVFDTTEFTVDACLRYEGKSAPSFTDAKVTLHVNAYDGRATFLSDSSLESNKTFSFNTKLSYGNETCTSVQVHISKSENEDFTKPIELRMDYRVIDQEFVPTNNVDDFCKTCAVVDPAAATFVTRKVPYATGCSDSVCRTDLEVQAAFQDLTSSIITGNQKKLGIKISVKNTGEPAFLVKVNVTFPSATPLSRLPLECQEVTSLDPGTSQEMQLECDVANPLQTGMEASFVLEVDTGSLTLKTEQLIYRFNTTSVGVDVNPSDNVQELRLSVESVADVCITGSSSHPRLVQSNTSQTFTHTYEVRNDGPSPVELILLELQIPVAVTTSGGIFAFLGVYQLTPVYLYENERQPFSCTTSADHSFIVDAEVAGSDSAGDTQSLRKRRSTDYNETKAETIMTGEDDVTLNETLFADCSNKEIQCMTVSCRVGPFLAAQTVAVLSLHMRANLTNLGPELKKKSMIISTIGKVKIVKPPSVRQPIHEKSDIFAVSTVVMLSWRMPYQTVFWWLLASAIAGGLLLLLLIAGILQKIGFFKRRKNEELDNTQEDELVGGKENASRINEGIDTNGEENNNP